MVVCRDHQHSQSLRLKSRAVRYFCACVSVDVFGVSPQISADLTCRVVVSYCPAISKLSKQKNEKMADVDVMHTVTEVKKTRKVKKSTTTSSSKRRESNDQGSEVQITEIEQTAVTETDGKGYVLQSQAGERPIKTRDRARHA